MCGGSAGGAQGNRTGPSRRRRDWNYEASPSPWMERGLKPPASFGGNSAGALCLTYPRPARSGARPGPVLLPEQKLFSPPFTEGLRLAPFTFRISLFVGPDAGSWLEDGIGGRRLSQRLLPVIRKSRRGGKEAVLLTLTNPRPPMKNPLSYYAESHDPASGPGAGFEIQGLFSNMSKVKVGTLPP